MHKCCYNTKNGSCDKDAFISLESPNGSDKWFCEDHAEQATLEKFNNQEILSVKIIIN